MATDVEKLVVQLSADIKQYQREMNRAQGVTNAQARAIENRYKQMDKRLATVGQSAARGLVAPLTGVAAALSVQEVFKYADAWTSAKNSLAVAGVVGANQAKVLDQIYDSAQRNAAPVGALAGLFGKAAQASDNLGATQDDLIRFSDGVGVALRVAGTGATEASGALTQLGQLLGSARVQAEEFNSVNEGARPILIAVANGLDAAGGSVNKLKQLVNDGAVSGKQFFDAFLKGLPSIQAMAANATQTIDQGMTKVNNAFTKYIGSQDQSLGATQMLTDGLNLLANDFDKVADVTLKVAAILSAAFVGRAIGGMLVSLGAGTVAIGKFVSAMKAARAAGSVSMAIGGIGAAAGPLGAIVGIAAAGALTYFGTQAIEASARSAKLKEEMKALGDTSEGAKGKIDAMTIALNKLAPDELLTRLSDINKEMDRMKGRSVMNVLGVADADTLGDVRATLKAMNGRADNRTAARQIESVLKAYDEGKLTLEDFNAQLDKISLTNPGEPIVKLITKLKEAIPYMKFLGTEAAKTSQAYENIGKVPATPYAEGYGANASRFKSDRDKSMAAANAFIDQREADAKRTAAEKELDARTDEIIKAAEKVGTSIDKAAAVVLAKAELANEKVTADQSKSMSSSFDLIKGYEGFSAKPYWDVNALRAGYGSDTVTLDDGSVRKVTEGITVTLAGATRDLERRISEFQKGIEGKIGADTFRSMDEGQQAALTSIAYNYGSLPDRIVAAIKSGDAGTVYSAIKGLGSDNGGINRGRRNSEAELYLKGAPSGVQQLVEGRESFAKGLDEYRQQLAFMKEESSLRSRLNPQTKEYESRLASLQAAQELLTMAQQDGNAAGRELSSAQQLLSGDLSGLCVEARETALAMRELALAKGEVVLADGRFSESQEELNDRLRESSALGKDVFGGFLQDLKSGKSATEALGDALGKLGDKLLENGLNMLFDGSVVGSGGGILGSLLSVFTGGPIKLANGGTATRTGVVRGPGGPRGDKIPAMLSDGEHITRSAMAKKYGPLLAAINADRVPHLVNGTSPLRAPTMPMLRNTRSGGSNDRVQLILQDDSGRMAEIADRRIRTASGTIVDVSVKRSTQTTSQSIAQMNANARLRGN